jgi:hypothetical protein
MSSLIFDSFNICNENLNEDSKINEGGVITKESDLFNQNYDQPDLNFDFMNPQSNEVSPFSTVSLFSDFATDFSLANSRNENGPIKNEEFLQQVLSDGERASQLDDSKTCKNFEQNINGSGLKLDKNDNLNFHPLLPSLISNPSDNKEHFFQNTSGENNDILNAANLNINNIDSQLKYHMDMVYNFF